MKPIGPVIKKFIEENQIKKMDVAEKVGISYNYLSTIFLKSSIDAALFEKICIAIGLNPISVFETSPELVAKNYRDINATTRVGNAAVSISDGGFCERLLEEKERVINEKERIIEEKERTIRILLKLDGSHADTPQ